MTRGFHECHSCCSLSDYHSLDTKLPISANKYIYIYFFTLNFTLIATCGFHIKATNKLQMVASVPKSYYRYKHEFLFRWFQVMVIDYPNTSIEVQWAHQLNSLARMASRQSIKINSSSFVSWFIQPKLM